MILLNGPVSNYIQRNGRKYSFFGGNDYFGLANHPAVKAASIQSIKKYGTNFSASRYTTGTADIHLKLEKKLSLFKGKQDSVVYASGYQGNSILLELLKNKYSIVFMDQFAHPSISTIIPKDIKNALQYNHCDTDHLENLLKKHKKHRSLIITDGIFALTGEISPIGEIYSLAKKYNALLIVDDAHATGVLGKNGRGTPEHFNLDGAANLYQSETMSKALGSYGGFIAANKAFIQDIKSGSKFYAASTALPPPLLAASYASLLLIEQYPELRVKVKENAELIRRGIKEMGFITAGEGTPIIPLLFKSLQTAKCIIMFLEENHIIATAVDYPVKMDNFLVRITVSSNHTKEQIEYLLYTLKKWSYKHDADYN